MSLSSLSFSLSYYLSRANINFQTKRGGQNSNDIRKEENDDREVPSKAASNHRQLRFRAQISQPLSVFVWEGPKQRFPWANGHPKMTALEERFPLVANMMAIKKYFLGWELRSKLKWWICWIVVLFHLFSL